MSALWNGPWFYVILVIAIGAAFFLIYRFVKFAMEEQYKATLRETLMRVYAAAVGKSLDPASPEGSLMKFMTGNRFIRIHYEGRHAGPLLEEEMVFELDKDRGTLVLRFLKLSDAPAEATKWGESLGKLRPIISEAMNTAKDVLHSVRAAANPPDFKRN